MLVKTFRFESGKDDAPYFEEFDVPCDGEATVMDVLDYISGHLDPTIAYYRHSACNHGICGRCLLRANGKAALACLTRVDSQKELVLEPAAGKQVVRDLVTMP